MNLYKFRSLNNQENFKRIKEIIKETQFHCSKFSNFNDPMEGIFLGNSKEQIKEIFSEKESYKICSFSGEKGFQNPAIWSYYTDTFRGMAIEIEINEEEFKRDFIPIKYQNKTKEIKIIKNISENHIKYILTRKSLAWKPENEYRFIKKQENDKYKISKISAVYFGKPYSNISNYNDIVIGNDNLRKKISNYENFKHQIISLLDQKKIKHFNVQIKEGRVEIIE